MVIAKIVNDCATGPDNRTYAVGRLYALPLLLVELAIPIWLLVHSVPLTLADLGIYWAASAAAVTALIRGTNATEPPGPPPSAAAAPSDGGGQ